MLKKFFHTIQLAFETAPVKMFVFIGFAIGLLYTLGSPPYYMLDEPNHFFRAYQISRGEIVPERIGDKTGGEIPRSMSASVYIFRFGIQQYDSGQLPVELIKGSMFQPLNEDETSFVAFSNTAIYSPLPYIPQAAAIGIGRIFDLSPLMLLYLGRLANLFFAVLLLATAMQLLPVFRWVMFLVLLSPTAMFQLSSLSGDAMLFACSFLFIGMVLRLSLSIDDGEKVGWVHIVWLALLSAGVALCKAAYFVLPLLVFLIPSKRVGGRWRLVMIVAGLIMVQLLAAIGWSAVIKEVYTPFMNPAVDPPAAIHWIISHPIIFAGIVIRDLLQHTWFYLHGLVGFQWNQQQVLLPDVFSVAYLSVIILTAILSGDTGISIGKRQRVILAGFFILGVLLVLVTVYASWMPPGSNTLDGVQGRYFIPIILPALLLFYTRKFAVQAVENTLAIILPLLTFISLIYALVMFHRLF